ncbi:MAG: bifunctional phosphoglucose/phosphomannose isomerase [Anaerolineae bacterium]|nr:bifunctional phosphoglucose/phosphomannose isomerase [Anaerolineae bacterium]MBT7070269.1 bifunctional phosphoglucose/phosphomannose isomerase [Anaerolineae bacterium]MBT7324277.1 bifunctional phosphoglucose/phosphomannose isomerase [Anaerolineae bacterium]
MLLDNHKDFTKLDPQNMLGEIDALPDHLAAAWELGQKQDLADFSKIRQIIIAGMGGSAIGADLLATYVAPICSVPIIVHRDYALPAFARGPETLFIASSHSGNTEETLTAFDAAVEAGCTIMALSTGGKLAKKAAEINAPVWKFDHAGQPRAAVGYSFGLLLALFVRAGFILSSEVDLLETVADLKSQQETLRADVLADQNPAKRSAGQAAGRWITVFGANYLAPVARRWTGQINEVAKAGSNFEFIPEADHNTLAGILYPEKVLLHTHSIFLRAKSDHPRNRLRSNLTRKTFMLEALSTDTVDARGKTPLSQMWTALHFGDYVSYYLAMIYGVDPTPVDALVMLKEKLAEH